MALLDAHCEEVIFTCGDAIFPNDEEGDGAKLADIFYNREALSCRDHVEKDFFNYGGLRSRTEFEHVCALCGKGPEESALVEKEQLLAHQTEGKFVLPLCSSCFEAGEMPMKAKRSDKVTEELERKEQKAKAKGAKSKVQKAEEPQAKVDKAKRGTVKKVPTAKQPSQQPHCSMDTFFSRMDKPAPSSSTDAGASQTGNTELKEQSAAAHAAALGGKSKRIGGDLRIEPFEKRCKTGGEALKELRLERQETSGFTFNCLAFSVLIGTKQIGASLAEQYAAQQLSIVERRLTHEAIMSRLPPATAETTVGPNDVWWVGQSRASLTRIFHDNAFMNEAHVHGFANRLDLTVVTIDERMPALVLSEFAPGYEKSRQLSIPEALELRNRSKQPVWVLLSSNHFSALLPIPRSKKKILVSDSDSYSSCSSPPVSDDENVVITSLISG